MHRQFSGIPARAGNAKSALFCREVMSRKNNE